MKKTIAILALIALLIVPAFARTRQRDNILSLTAGPEWQMTTTTDDQGNTVIKDGKRFGIGVDAFGAFYFTAKLPVALTAAVNFSFPVKYTTSSGEQDISDNPTIATFKAGALYAYDASRDITLYAGLDLGFSVQKWTAEIPGVTTKTTITKLSLGLNAKSEYHLENNLSLIAGMVFTLPLSYTTRVSVGNASATTDAYKIKGFEITVPMGASIAY
ncbi:MAG: outer membrane beta-barrel protein [Sphaerochaetaceae bacterium]|jgi:hypothetical protein